MYEKPVLLWDNILTDYYNHSLPKDLFEIFKNIDKKYSRLIGMPLVNDIISINSFLKYTNKDICKDEVVVLHSQKLEKIIESLTVEEDIEWLGLDVFDIGNWSWLKDGLFLKPELFNEFLNEINENGLFPLDFNKKIEYEMKYRTLAAQGELESGIELPHGVDWIKVGRLKHI